MAAKNSHYILHDAPEVAYHDAPEALKDTAGLEVAYGDGLEPVDCYKPPKRLLGLKPIVFWGLVVLAVTIVAAVGGGIGGSMASKSSSSSSSTNTDRIVAADGIASGSTFDGTSAIQSAPTPSASVQSSAGFSIAADPTTKTSGELEVPSFTRSPSATATRLPDFVTSNIKGYTGCDSSNGTVLRTSPGGNFQVICDRLWSWGRDDLANPAVDNLEGCIRACSEWNEKSTRTQLCYLAVFGKLNTHVGVLNCWLKSSTMGEGGGLIPDSTVASGMLLPNTVASSRS